VAIESRISIGVAADEVGKGSRVLGTTASLKKSGISNVAVCAINVSETKQDKASSYGHFYTLVAEVDVGGACCLATCDFLVRGDGALGPFQGMRNVFAIVGQRSVVAAATLWKDNM
jgi:hypothetical protein